MNLIPTNILALGSLVDTAINDWIGPVFVIILAVIAITLAIRKQLAAFLSFALVAVIAGIFVFFGSDIFGKNGNITKAGKDIAKKINVIDLTDTTYSQDFLKLDR